MRSCFNRLSSKILLAIILWLVCALMFTGLTLNLTWELESGGVMINQAGSLRVRTSHMALRAASGANHAELTTRYQEFNALLNHLENTQPSSLLTSYIHLDPQIKNIRSAAQQLFNQLVNSKNEKEVEARTLQQVDHLITEIDDLVFTLERNNTHNIKLLRIFQFILIGMVILSAFITLLFLNIFVIRPLNAINTGIQKIGRGELNAKIDKITQDEFGEVALGFNKMAANLKDLYENLELKVKDKTIALQKRNDELKVLYEVTAFLHEAQELNKIINEFLKRIITVANAKAAVLKILEDNNQKLESTYKEGFTAQTEPKNLLSIDDYLILSNPEANPATTAQAASQATATAPINLSSNYPAPCQVFMATQESHATLPHTLTFHVSHHSEVGYLKLYFDHPPQLSDKNTQLICVLTRQLGVAIENRKLVKLHKHLAILEERNLVAQNLHDNIAQSLSFLNIQAQMLKDAIQKENTPQALENANFIQTGIQESYEDVRELLLDFRTKVNAQDFKETIRSVVTRFKDQTQATIKLELHSKGEQLEVGQHLQVVFILQEALSNIRKHANAKNVTISIEQDKSFFMKVEDDGVGFSLESIENKELHHVGMGIMQERAKRAHGKLNISSVINHGTTVTLEVPFADNQGK